VLYQSDADAPAHLLIVVHHLATDGVSWRILLEDLWQAYEQAASGREIRLPAKTTSFQQWAERLAEYARSREALEELGYWTGDSRAIPCPIPVDFPDGPNTVESERSLSVALEREETRLLVDGVSSAHQARLHEALLAALSMTLLPWTGRPAIVVDVEGHGREELWPDVDLSRTVGWFTSIFPLVLESPATKSSADALRSMRDSLRRVPNGGIGYGVLRYLRGDPEVARRLEAMPQAEISFNYLGQFGRGGRGSPDVRRAAISPGAGRSPRQIRRYLLDINAVLVDGVLELTWSFSVSRYRPSTIQSLAQRFVDCLRVLIASCSSAARGYAPADFPDVDLSQEDLDAVLAEISAPAEDEPHG
jgi:non-ribosomal peptide synthase protein (TIGR01720 family)